MRILMISLILAIGMLGANPTRADLTSPKTPEQLEICEKAVTAAEQKHRLPKRLLAALSLTESGHWEKSTQEMIAWPWTVYAEGRGRYLPTKAEAIDEVKLLQAKGVQNIDVGCMQVNLYYHPDAFENLEAALDPEQNALYAAELLKELQAESRSWNIAIAHYHSRNSKFNVPYRQKVFKIWQQERRKDTDARMAAAREEYRLRRENLAKHIKEASQRRFTQENARKMETNADAS
ncbi:MAG: transglycosylase SLT domain-containing protein [Sneathiella sp.]|nr:transglycosylase SLT domain-containing protein [Sneathiella sp.]